MPRRTAESAKTLVQCSRADARGDRQIINCNRLLPQQNGKIVINHLDLRPAEDGQTIAHGILQRAALAVVQNLMSR